MGPHPLGHEARPFGSEARFGRGVSGAPGLTPCSDFLPQGPWYQYIGSLSITFSYQNHLFCRLPTISIYIYIYGFILRTYKNHGYGNQWKH